MYKLLAITFAGVLIAGCNGKCGKGSSTVLGTGEQRERCFISVDATDHEVEHSYVINNKSDEVNKNEIY